MREKTGKDVLRGNFATRRRVVVDNDDDIGRRFEREALKRLGGSIAFVRKKGFLYDAESTRASGEAPREA